MDTQTLASLRVPLLVGMLVLWMVLESAFPLRRMTQPKGSRLARNLTIAIFAAAVMRFTVVPILVWVAAYAGEREWGLLRMVEWPGWVETFVAVALLDFTLFHWHLMNHRFGFLWRFHNVHHSDLDMDVTTASRFHFGELILSAGYRAMQIVLFGVTPLQLLIFELAVTMSAQFHHSNLRLPVIFERWLNKLVVTPRMHGVHHSIVQGETDSNFSAIFSAWDRLHGTLRLGVAQRDITIGVAAYRDPRELTLLRCLFSLPFTRPRAWRLPDGRVPQRRSVAKPSLLVD